MTTSLKWLAPASLKRNFDLQELIALVLPTTYAYYSTLPKIVDLPESVVICTTVLVFSFLFLYKIYKNFSSKEKAISEVLETGYFNNFFRPVFTVITESLKSGQKLRFDFKNPNQPPILTDDIDVKIILPPSKDQLGDAMKQISSITQDASINHGAWVSVQVLANNKIVIYECPRTLAAIEKHLASANDDYTNEDSVKFHRYFIEKFMDDYKPTNFNFEISSAL